MLLDKKEEQVEDIEFQIRANEKAIKSLSKSNRVFTYFREVWDQRRAQRGHDQTNWLLLPDLTDWDWCKRNWTHMGDQGSLEP